MRIKRTLPALALGLLLVAGCGQTTDNDSPAPAPTDVGTVTPTLATPDEQATSAEETPPETEPTNSAETPKAPGTEPTAPVTEDPSTMEPVEGEWVAMDVQIKTADDVAEIADLPEDFQAFVASIAGVTDSDGCTTEITLTSYHPAGFATGSEFAPGCGGSLAVWSKAGGSWATALSMQALLPCSEFENNYIPKGSPELVCLDSSGNQVNW